MAKEKKNQHYVPRAYLDAWEANGKYQIHVYDKETKRAFVSSIYGVATERYFYDIDYSGVFTDEIFEKMGIFGCDPKSLDDEQFIENFFSKEIEGSLREHLDGIRKRIATMTPWEIENCTFITEEKKISFSAHLAWQYLRVKSVRRMMVDALDCLEQSMIDMHASQEMKDRYLAPENQLPYIHGSMLLDFEEIKKLALRFHELTWFLQVNRTKTPFYTSDNPIGTTAHISHPYMAMSGIGSEGVEAYFPISPKLMLVMLDGDYHTEFKPYDRRIMEVTDSDTVKYHNMRAATHSDRWVYSCDKDFSCIEELLESDPDIFKKPRMTLQWTGKVYTPRNA